MYIPIIVLGIIYLYNFSKIERRKKIFSISILIISICIISLHLMQLFKNGIFVVGSDSADYVEKAKQTAINIRYGFPLNYGIYYIRNSYKLFVAILSLGYIFFNNDYLATIYNIVIYILIFNIFYVRWIKYIKCKKIDMVIYSLISCGCIYSIMIYSRDFYISILIIEIFILTWKYKKNKNMIYLVKFALLLILLELFRENFSVIILASFILVILSEKIQKYLKIKYINIFIMLCGIIGYMIILPYVNKEINSNNILIGIYQFIVAILSDNPFKFIIYPLIGIDINTMFDTLVMNILVIIISFIIVWYVYNYLITYSLYKNKYCNLSMISKSAIIFFVMSYVTYSMSFNVQFRIKIVSIIPLAYVLLSDINKNKIKIQKKVILLGILLFCIIDFMFKVLIKL